MRINTNVAALNTHGILSRTNTDLTRSIGRLSSGFRINRAADDAAGLAIANRLQADIRSLRQAARNAEQANSVLQIAEGAASSLNDILSRMKELATQAASDTVGADERTTINDEYSTLISEIDRIVDSTQFQETTLLDGSFTGSTFQIGSSNDANDQLSVTLGDLNAEAIGTDGGTQLDATSVTDVASAQAALTVIDDAISDVNNTLGDIGAFQNRLEYASTNLSTAIENFSAAESVIRDVDMAAEMINLTKNQILQQVGTAMLAQANVSPQMVLQLLG